MSYYAFYHVLIQKDNRGVDYEELPKDLVKLLNEATADIEGDDDEYSFDGLHDTHDSELDDKFLEISRQLCERRIIDYAHKLLLGNLNSCDI